MCDAGHVLRPILPGVTDDTCRARGIVAMLCVMRILAVALVLSLVCAACSSWEGVVGDECGGPAERQLVDRVSCDGAKHAEACAAAELPSVYGVDEGCTIPLRSVRGECLRRPDGVEGCTAIGRALCCPL